MDRGGVGRAVAVGAVFALLGPVIGTTLALTALAGALMAMDPLSGLLSLFIWPMAVLIGFILGIGPSVITGVVMALASRRLKAWWSWIGVGVACGLVSTWAVHRFLDAGTDDGLVLGAAAGAAALCALITLGWRPRGA